MTRKQRQVVIEFTDELIDTIADMLIEKMIPIASTAPEAMWYEQADKAYWYQQVDMYIADLRAKIRKLVK